MHIANILAENILYSCSPAFLSPFLHRSTILSKLHIDNYCLDALFCKWLRSLREKNEKKSLSAKKLSFFLHRIVFLRIFAV